MGGPRELVPMVEGDGDVLAVPLLLTQLMTELGSWDAVFLGKPMRVGGVGDLAKNDGAEWKRYLQAAKKRPKAAGVLLIQDGDETSVRRESFCPATFAQRYADWAKEVGGGEAFSVAAVFARQEFESWLMPCANKLARLKLPDGRQGVNEGTTAPEDDVEEQPRGAKEWWNKRMEDGYKPTRDQHLLTKLALDHLQVIRERNMRSFRRLEKAVAELVQAIRDNKPMVSPVAPSE